MLVTFLCDYPFPLIATLFNQPWFTTSIYTLHIYIYVISQAMAMNNSTYVVSRCDHVAITDSWLRISSKLRMCLLFLRIWSQISLTLDESISSQKRYLITQNSQTTPRNFTVHTLPTCRYLVQPASNDCIKSHRVYQYVSEYSYLRAETPEEKQRYVSAGRPHLFI